MNHVRIKRVTELSELTGIQRLQGINLKKNLTAAEIEKEGFVTAEYSVEFLQLLHNTSPSVIAVDGEMVVGYALVALRSTAQHHELLADLFEKIDNAIYQGSMLRDSNYVVVGQLCVHKDYRGFGLVQSMYTYYKECLSPEFDYCITDVASTNPRSLKAHQKTGFQVIDTLHFNGQEFDLILWDWNADPVY